MGRMDDRGRRCALTAPFSFFFCFCLFVCLSSVLPAKIKTPIEHKDFSVAAVGREVYWPGAGNIAVAHEEGSKMTSFYFRALILCTHHLPVLSAKGLTQSNSDKPSLLLPEVQRSTTASHSRTRTWARTCASHPGETFFFFRSFCYSFCDRMSPSSPSLPPPPSSNCATRLSTRSRRTMLTCAKSRRRISSLSARRCRPTSSALQ